MACSTWPTFDKSVCSNYVGKYLSNVFTFGKIKEDIFGVGNVIKIGCSFVFYLR